MPTPQVAINGLKRCLQCVEEQANSNSTLYASNIGKFVEIRQLALQIAELSEVALKKSGIDFGYSDKIHSEGLSTLTELISQTVMKTLDSHQIVESNVVDTVKDEDVEFTKSEKIDLNKFTRDFKSVLQTTEIELIKSNNTERHVFECAKMCRTYFEIRFDKRNDIHNLHRFDRKQFKNYLASLVLAYGRSIVCREEELFRDKFYSWIEEVKEGKSPYTMPKFVAEIYFNIIQDKTEDNTYEFSKVWWNKGVQLWKSLWKSGYSEFTKICRDLSPTENLSWIENKFLKHSLLKDYNSENIIHSCKNIHYGTGYTNEECFDIAYKYFVEETDIVPDPISIREVKEIWVEYIEYLSDSVIIRYPEIQLEMCPKLRELFGEELIISTATSAKSFIFYSVRYPDKLEELRLNVVNMQETNSNILKSNAEVIEDILKSTNPCSLDVIDVYLHYLDWYREVEDVKSEFAFTAN